MKLKIKEEYKNATLTKGDVVLKTNNLKENHYQYYYDNGFSHLFTVIEETPKINYKGVEEPIKKRRTKKK